MVKIKTISVKRKKITGFMITIPQVFMEDNFVSQGDSIEIYRSTERADELIIKIKKAGDPV
jgi:hypothetical protein